jgi:hypothetical protein
MIHNSGYRQTFFVFGVIQGIAIFILSIALIRPNPGPGIKPVARVVTSKVDYTPGQMVRTPLFWMIYLLFVLVAAGGLVATAQLGPIAKAFGFAKLPVQFFGATLPLLTLALSIDNLLNGLTRPVCGFLSDKIGRENTMLLVFVGEGLALLGMNAYGHDPYAFLIFAPLIFLCWGEIFSIFPAICADTFGSKYASSNAGTLYTAKGTASLLVPIASLVAAGGSWEHVLVGCAVVSVAAGVSARFILAPMRRRWFAGMGDEVAPVLQTQRASRHLRSGGLAVVGEGKLSFAVSTCASVINRVAHSGPSGGQADQARGSGPCLERRQQRVPEPLADPKDICCGVQLVCSRLLPAGPTVRAPRHAWVNHWMVGRRKRPVQAMRPQQRPV